MSTSLPSLTDASKATALLRDIIEELAKSHAFPRDAVIRAQHEPWLVDDLQQVGWLAGWNGTHLIPTLDGLHAIQTDAAAEILAKAMMVPLQELYREDPTRSWSIAEIAQRAGLVEQVAAPIVTILLVSTRIYSSAGSDGATGCATTVQLSERVLEVNPFATTTEPEPPEGPCPVTLSVRDFRGLAQVDWSPEGVCLVVGPNGSGKTTLLDAISFLCGAFARGVPQAVTVQRGPAGLRRLGAPGPEEVVLELKVGDASWTLRLNLDGGGVGEYPAELVQVGSGVLVRRAANVPDWYFGRRRQPPDPEGRTCLRAAWEAHRPKELAALVETLLGFRYYGAYRMDVLRFQGGVGGEMDQQLYPMGENLFVVLRNWKAAPRRFRDQFAWVLRHIQRAFPRMIEDLEFDPPVGQVVPVRFYMPGVPRPLPIHRAADGLLVGLLHLTAVAGAAEGSLIAIEEMENLLHPHAIRSLLASMRELAEERRLTILLTTHSPVLMNGFREHPEQVYVMESGQQTLPVPLDKLHDPDWLVHFSLGDLYDRMEFGAPPRAQEA